MKEKFFNILNYDNTVITYCTIKNIYQVRYFIDMFVKKNENCKIYLFYNSHQQLTNCYTEKIKIIQTYIDFELFFYLHLLRHNYFYKNNIMDILTDKSKLIYLHNKINYDEQCHQSNVNFIKNKLNYSDIFENIKNNKEIYLQVMQNKQIIDIEYYNIHLNAFDDLLNTNANIINKNFNFKIFMDIYSIEPSDNIYNIFEAKLITLNDVYYINRHWFNSNKQIMECDDFYNDIEYSQFKHLNYNKNILDITNYEINEIIDEEVIYLDYIYSFYNFGEFWDCLRRILLFKSKGIGNLPVFHLAHNRITNINYFFEKTNFIFPSNYQTKENNCKLYFFKKINIMTICGTHRSYYDKYIAYNFNKSFNPNYDTLKTGNKFNLYLARGQFGRSIVNEQDILNKIVLKYNFTVLNGSESFDEIMHYFTNANIILGPHGSLMKNTIWCLNNPIFIELGSVTRNASFSYNSVSCNFTTFYFKCICNENEEVLLSDDQLNGLYELLDILLPNKI